jgi:hypothetical protein
MPVMAVNNHNEQGKDHRSQPRWSAGKKTEVVLRLLRGESLEELSRELPGWASPTTIDWIAAMVLDRLDGASPWWQSNRSPEPHIDKHAAYEVKV